MKRILMLLIMHFTRPIDNSLTSVRAETSESSVPRSKADPIQVPTSSDFADIRRSKAFIDKTDFIHEWILHQPVHLSISAPPSSGKSALLSMIRYFCNVSTDIQHGALIFHADGDSKTRDLFRDTTVARLKGFHDQHFQKYSVVNVELAPLRYATDRASFEQNLCFVMRNMVNDYQFLADVTGLNESEKTFFLGYKGRDDNLCRQNFEFATKQHGPQLVGILKKYLGINVIVLVDDVDAVLDAFVTQDNANSFAESAISCIKRFILSLIVNEKGLCEGPVASKLLMMSSFEPSLILPDVDQLITGVEFDRVPRLGSYFGLTKPEVDKLLAQYSLQDHSRTVADLYDGHTVVRSPSVYNIGSVLKYIQNRGVPPATKTSSPILRNFQKLFSDAWIGLAMTSCVFDGTFAMSAIYRTQYQNLLALKQKLQKASPFQTDLKLSTLDHEIFIKLLIRSGLIQVLEDFLILELGFEVTYHRLAPTNYFTAGILRDYLYKSGYTEKLFGIKARDEIAITDAFKNLAPTIASIEKLKDAIHSIVQMRDPEDETNLKALVYTFARKTADHYSKDLIVDAEIAAHSKDEERVKKWKGKSIKERRVDVLMVQKGKGLGVVIKSKYGGNATSLLNEMANRAFLNIFYNNVVYSKYKIKDTMLLAISVTRKAVDIYGELHTSAGTVTLGARRKLSHQ